MTEASHEGEPVESIGAPMAAEMGETALLGVGRLAEVIGVEEARDWFDERQARIDFLHSRALRRHGPPDPTARFR